MKAHGISWLLALLLCLGMGARAGNVVKLSSTEGKPEEEVTVSLSLENSEGVAAMQVSIPMDENLTLVEGSAQVGSRASGHSVTAGVKDGVLNVMVYSIGMNTFSGNSGVVATWKMKLGNQPKTVALTPSKVTLTNANGSEVASTVESGAVTIVCAKAQYGSMTIDFGEVPIKDTYTQEVWVTNVGNADLVLTGLEFSDVNVFSSTTSFPQTVAAGESTPLNVTYKPTTRGSVGKTVKVLCNSISKLNTIKLLAKPFAVNELHVQPASGMSDEEVDIHLLMNNMDGISGYQVEFQMPEQLEYVEGSFVLSSRKVDHQASSLLKDGVLRIIVYSSTDKALTGTEGEIGSFKVKLSGRYGTELKPTKTVLSATINKKVENVVSEVYGGYVEIRSPQISASSTLDFGEVSVTEKAEKTFSIYNSGNAPLTVSRIVFDNENLSVKEVMPLVIPKYESKEVTVVYGSVEQKAFEATMQLYSNDPDQRLWNVAVTGSRFASNYLEISTADVYADDVLSIDVSVNTYDPITGLQFDVVYPQKVYEPYEDNVVLEARAKGMTLTSREIETGTLRYFCYFLGGDAIAAGSGKAFSIKMRPINDEAPVGNYIVYVKNIKLGTSEMVDKYAGTDTESRFMVKTHSPVTIAAQNVTMVYGDAVPELTYTSAGEDLEGVPVITCAATSASAVGTYPIVLTIGSVKNKDVSLVNGTLTVTKAPLTITVQNCTMKQGEALPEFEVAYTGFKNDETESVLTKKPMATCTATSSNRPGQYDIVVDGAEAKNYDMLYVKGTLTIANADPVVVTAKSYTREYGEENPTFEYTSTGKALDGTPDISCAATVASPVGTYPIIVSKGGVKNYNDSYVNGTLTITKAPLTVTAKSYVIKQGEALPNLEIEYNGFKNNEAKDVLTQLPDVTCAAASSEVLGTYEITVSGAEAQNYDISYVYGTLTVIEADAVVVTAKSYTREYGEENPTFEYTSVGVALEGNPAISCEATASSPVGTYPIVITKGSVTNYNDTYINGMLTITKAPLTISAQSYVIKQGEALPAFGVTYTGFKMNETESVLTKMPTVTCTATSSGVLGTYDIVVSDAEALNYECSYVNGTLTVVDADAVVVTAKSYTREYGEANPTFEHESSGAALDGTPDISCEATEASPVGTYPIVITKGGV
ncbi:MAG: choice-of-anchor D domain-containing protein, partial [Bacteroidaceae bacterium]|nr:choice-of-anchor D domain-containing protein [Bacteroidaceae bacterium]